MLLDTGADVTTLSNKTAAELKLNSTRNADILDKFDLSVDYGAHTVALLEHQRRPRKQPETPSTAT